MSVEKSGSEYIKRIWKVIIAMFDIDGMIDYSEQVLLEIKEKELPLVVWGFGGMISFIVSNIREFGMDISYIIDNNEKKWGKTYCGIPIISFGKLKDSCADCCILIGVCTKKYVDEITKQIIKDGQFKSLYFFEMFYPFGVKNKDTFRKNIGSINKVRELLEDEKSKLVFEKKLRYIINKEADELVEISDPECDQYFDDKLIRFDNKEVCFIDGGAYHGENTDEIRRKFPNRDFIAVCIDADFENVDYLIKKYENSSSTFVKWAALARNTGELRFTNSGSRGGQIGNGEDSIVVPSIGIDDEFFSNMRVGFIKLDIEGSEKECLWGAKKTIERDRPILAVCNYHSVEDHWDIPLLIKSIRPDYKIYMRHYHYTGIETVVYAL